MRIPALVTRASAWLAAHLPDRWDVVIGAGALVLVVGVGMVYRPAGVILLGLELVLVGLLGAAHPAKGGEA